LDYFENPKVICTAPVLGLTSGIFFIILGPKLNEEKRLNFSGGKIRRRIIIRRIIRRRRKQKLSKTNV
jgi:hypothetical protein